MSEKLNQARINELIKEACDLDLQVHNFAGKYDDETGKLTDASLLEFDALGARLHGLYHRIGQLIVDQEIYEQHVGLPPIMIELTKDD